ncbi:synaptic vesicle glycoprotein 2C-like [Cylas formicarius]|uniref:synaptic vesicle glycoprotein 2C-like n=1 Tax=Cylas formicarius TaxID=197179 RepID=UPI0029583BFF|nr:synaptic vesicle glycoprotein 2C-like [Cylas formicarius]
MKMCEESACLVPPPEQTQNELEPERETSLSNNGEALVGFHEDALSQATTGKAQILLAVVLGFGLASECGESTMLNFILPAAELHLCIEERKKGWLVSITLLALATGSTTWGILGDYIGRRRSLIAALSVSALFSAVASVMPTYGTFMTARFCSGLGVAGAFPLSFAYLTETCSRATRSRYVGVLYAMWPLGAIYTAVLFRATMPTLGEDLVNDNREHWSSWHRFLILSALPTIGCIIGLLWASESPRYLLEASREVEALAVYQRLHKLNKTRTQYGLTELELPGRSAYRETSPTSPGNLLTDGVATFREAFFKIFSPARFRITILLATVHLLVGLVYMGISTYSTTLIKEEREREYGSHRKFVQDVSFGGTFNETIENLQYKDCLFRRVTFAHINLNHVEFLNCTFEEAEFINVKTSVSFFEYSIIRDSRFIDTDLRDYNFVGCVLVNNTFISLISECVVDFDYNIYLEDLYDETLAWSSFMVPTLFSYGFAMETVSRTRAVVITLALASQAGGGILFFHLFGYSTMVFVAVEVVLKVLLVCSLNALTLVVVEAYPCDLRCTAHGFMRSAFHLASLCAVPIFGTLAHTTLLFAAVVTMAVAFCAALLSLKIQDNSKVLL